MKRFKASILTGIGLVWQWVVKHRDPWRKDQPVEGPPLGETAPAPPHPETPAGPLASAEIELTVEGAPDSSFPPGAGTHSLALWEEAEEENRDEDPSVPVRVVAPGRGGWAQRRQERVQAVLGVETYRNLEGLMRWCWGEAVASLLPEMSVGRSGFYYRLEQVLVRLPQAFADGRERNGRAGADLDDALTERIVEIVVGQPGITPAAVRQRLAQQDGTQVGIEEVAAYLAQARLTNYQGSPYHPVAAAPVAAAEDRFSRYAAHLWQVPALEQLGFYQAAPRLDVTGPQTYYSHLLRCHTVLLALSSGKTRLYHTGELVEDEFARMLGETRYPQRSDLHAYLDRIVEQDQAQMEQGVPEPDRRVEQFLRQAQQGLAQAAPAGAGRALYVDPHVVALSTAKPVARTKHGVSQRVVKALVKLRVASADAPGRPLAFLLGQGDQSFHARLEEAVDRTAGATGQAVELVGVDRGALSQAVLERFAQRGIGLTVWSEDTPTMREGMAAVERSAFQDAEYETVRRADGKRVQRLKTRVAEAPDLVINRQGYRCRTIVVEEVSSKRRMGIHAVGAPTATMTAREILDFMRGKQWIEEEIKQGIAWGSDAFCGGKIAPVLRRERPAAEEVEAWKVRARRLKGRWRGNQAEEGAAVAEWRAGKRTKRQRNEELKGLRRRRKRIEADWQQAEEMIRWGQVGGVPKSQVQWVVDTRKMAILSQFQDFARLARREIRDRMRDYLQEAVVESAVAEQGGRVSPSRRQEIEAEAERQVDRLPWGQLETRWFDQGGWVHKDPQQRVLAVTLKAFPNPLWQRACELLCDHLNQRQAVMRCQDGDYTLRYDCRASPPP